MPVFYNLALPIARKINSCGEQISTRNAVGAASPLPVHHRIHASLPTLFRSRIAPLQSFVGDRNRGLRKLLPPVKRIHHNPVNSSMNAIPEGLELRVFLLTDVSWSHRCPSIVPLTWGRCNWSLSEWCPWEFPDRWWIPAWALLRRFELIWV